jgi:hypothetical protein
MSIILEPMLLVSLVVAFAIGGVAFWQFVIRTEWSAVHAYGIASLIAMFAITVSTAILMPEPLPDVELTREDGRVVSGKLIVQTGTTWYIEETSRSAPEAEEDDTPELDPVSAIPAGDVEETIVTQRERDPKKSLLQVLIHKEPGEPLFD